MDDQNVYDVIMAAINTKELTTAKLGNLLSHELNTSRRQMKRGRAIRTDMEDMDKKIGCDVLPLFQRMQYKLVS